MYRIRVHYYRDSDTKHFGIKKRITVEKFRQLVSWFGFKYGREMWITERYPSYDTYDDYEFETVEHAKTWIANEKKPLPYDEIITIKDAV